MFALSQNYPNPFNPSTTIDYHIAEGGYVELSVINQLGQVVALLVDEYRSAGDYSVVFDAAGLPSGPYFYVITTAGTREMRAMLLMK